MHICIHTYARSGETGPGPSGFAPWRRQDYNVSFRLLLLLLLSSSCIYKNMCMCIYVYMCVCVYVYIYIYICIYVALARHWTAGWSFRMFMLLTKKVNDYKTLQR